jgi:hypothetical protein
VLARLRSRVWSWPLVLLAFPGAAEVWSGWVRIAQKTGFGRVSPLPGIWSSLHLNTTITHPIGDTRRSRRETPGCQPSRKLPDPTRWQSRSASDHNATRIG